MMDQSPWLPFAGGKPTPQLLDFKVQSMRLNQSPEL